MNKSKTIVAAILLTLTVACGVDYSSQDAGSEAGDWIYTDKVDNITESRTRVAQIESSSTLEFDFPYQGEQRAILLMGKMGDEFLVNIKVKKGQFTCITGCSIDTKFSNIPFYVEKANFSEDYSSDTLVLVNSRIFIENALENDEVIVEAVFYREGAQEITFDLSGLDKTFFD